MDYDVIVVGLGAMGGAASYQLARRGQRVLGLDAFEAGHLQGSSHGESRIIRMAYFEHPSYVPLLRRAYTLWESIQTQAEPGRELLRITGGLFVGQPDSPLVAGSLRSAREHDLPHEMLDAAAIRARFPALRPLADEVGVFEARAGVLFPERCVATHLELAAAAGADLHHAEPVERWQAHADGVEVTTPHGRYQGRRLVLAAGAWMPRLLMLDLALRVERIPVVWFQPRLPADVPIYIWDVGASIFYGVPHLEWPGAKVGRHHQGQICDPSTVDREATDGDEQPMREFVASRIPALDGPAVKRMICLYTNTPDENFAIDLHPDHSNVVFAAGFSGHGFKFASVVGEILADLAMTGQATADAEFLRLAPRYQAAAPRT